MFKFITTYSLIVFPLLLLRQMNGSLLEYCLIKLQIMTIHNVIVTAKFFKYNTNKQFHVSINSSLVSFIFLENIVFNSSPSDDGSWKETKAMNIFPGKRYLETRERSVDRAKRAKVVETRKSFLMQSNASF